MSCLLRGRTTHRRSASHSPNRRTSCMTTATSPDIPRPTSPRCEVLSHPLPFWHRRAYVTRIASPVVRLPRFRNVTWSVAKEISPDQGCRRESPPKGTAAELGVIWKTRTSSLFALEEWGIEHAARKPPDDEVEEGEAADKGEGMDRGQAQSVDVHKPLPELPVPAIEECEDTGKGETDDDSIGWWGLESLFTEEGNDEGLQRDVAHQPRLKGPRNKGDAERGEGEEDTDERHDCTGGDSDRLSISTAMTSSPRSSPSSPLPLPLGSTQTSCDSASLVLPIAVQSSCSYSSDPREAISPSPAIERAVSVTLFPPTTAIMAATAPSSVYSRETGEVEDLPPRRIISPDSASHPVGRPPPSRTSSFFSTYLRNETRWFGSVDGGDRDDDRERDSHDHTDIGSHHNSEGQRDPVATRLDDPCHSARSPPESPNSRLATARRSGSDRSRNLGCGLGTALSFASGSGTTVDATSSDNGVTEDAPSNSHVTMTTESATSQRKHVPRMKEMSSRTRKVSQSSGRALRITSHLFIFP
ncbi:MAG: hypothetical protein M1817_006094 [Caeruleum heppii]|nr:MAG: hypothetical protein M1817_006094 [Caeruleum heppii]